jgi:hypothetical protein
MSDTDPMQPTQTTPSQGEKLVIYRKKNPIVAMFIHSGGPAGLRLRPVLLRCLNSLGTTASFSSLSQLGFTTSQLGLAN